jgi:hypothetical protein
MPWAPALAAPVSAVPDAPAFVLALLGAAFVFIASRRA